ncbi:hypothetical protein [Porphyromonas bennonis]|uniref:hypothetical protein n=1 Tax=Porphyromonas bennonis TaxID=501496 RepID=UPI00037D83DB|nr:hypothetical protein [Porphyromonas bennonis]
MGKIYNALTALFMLLAVGAVVIYFAMPQDKTWFFIVGGVAIVLRLGQYIWKLMHPVRRRRSSDF